MFAIGLEKTAKITERTIEGEKYYSSDVPAISLSAKKHHAEHKINAKGADATAEYLGVKRSGYGYKAGLGAAIGGLAGSVVSRGHHVGTGVGAGLGLTAGLAHHYMKRRSQKKMWMPGDKPMHYPFHSREEATKFEKEIEEKNKDKK